MADSKIIQRAQSEGTSEAQVARFNRGDDYVYTEEKARQTATMKWSGSYIYQKNWDEETKQAYVEAFVAEILKSNP